MIKILVVSQNEVVGAGVVSLLRAIDNFEIQYLSFQPNSFFAHIFEDPPDIVFIELGYKDLDGFYVGREICKIKPDVKVVYISDSERFAAEAFEENATDYLVCPITKERLEVTISRINCDTRFK